MGRVIVLGSLNVDLEVHVPAMPSSGEKVMGDRLMRFAGGKGGNQAVAAARFGARVAFGGQTGADDFGDRLRRNLADAAVDIACVGTDPSTGSGMSVAITEQQGEYGAVVVSGANLTIDAGRISHDWRALWDCKALLLQNEIAEAVSLAAAREAKRRGARVVLNAAPARTTSSALLDLVDVLVVNRVEARMLSGLDDPFAALEALGSETRDVLLTRGGDGLLVRSREGAVQEIAALPVKLVSSHGAGDCFCGALAARLAAGDDLISACLYARTAAGLFVALPEAERSGLTPDAVVRASTTH